MLQPTKLGRKAFYSRQIQDKIGRSIGKKPSSFASPEQHGLGEIEARG